MQLQLPIMLSEIETIEVEDYTCPIPVLARVYTGEISVSPLPECRELSTDLAILVSPHEDVPIIPLVEQQIDLPLGHYDLDWLDQSPASLAYIARDGGHMVDEADATKYAYYKISESVHNQIRDATSELHLLFVHATEHVLLNPTKYWHLFDFPADYWPMALKSFEKKELSLAGRFDFSISDRGVKCYEYNADSASCLYECGFMQDAFMKACHLDEGIDGGAETASAVTAAWKSRFENAEIKNPVVHFMCDSSDTEELYHMEYMIQLAKAGGVVCKIISNLNGTKFSDEGYILDRDGERIHHLWKTWSYTTLLSQLESQGPVRAAGDSVRLIDLCFSEHVGVIEPVWTAITANKAILPVLYELFPLCPYLLESSMKLTASLKKAAGYVTKPISGRCGENVTLHINKPEEFDLAGPGFDEDDPEGILASDGRFDECPLVYQELCPLIRINEAFIQINTFCAGGRYAGTVLRVDAFAIIGKESDSYPLRVVSDDMM